MATLEIFLVADGGGDINTEENLSLREAKKQAKNIIEHGYTFSPGPGILLFFPASRIQVVRLKE